MNIHYEKLSLVDLTAPRALSHCNRTGNNTSNEIITQNLEDAETILKSAGLNLNLRSENIFEAREKYMIETHTINKVTNPSKDKTVSMRRKGGLRPHYTRLLIFDNRLVFQAACCLPLKIMAASLDCNTVSGRVVFSSHSEKSGGKLVYEFLEKGTDMIIDLRRGESTRAQRLIFSGMA